MDRAIYLLELSVADLALLYQLARAEKKTINQFILEAVVEKIEKIQESLSKEVSK